MSEANKEHVRQWVDALRSGEYFQAKGALRRGQRYCCLGVVCDISALGEWEQVSGTPSMDYLGSAAMLPEPVQGWLGIIGGNVPIRMGYLHPDRDGSTFQTLTSLNDSGFTFDQIADLIEWAYLS